MKIGQAIFEKSRAQSLLRKNREKETNETKRKQYGCSLDTEKFNEYE